MRRLNPRRRRRGAAIVEFAIIAPILFMLVLGSVEFGRAVMAKDLLANAARAGARTGALPGKSNTDIKSQATTSLSDSGVSGATIAITVNGAATDAGSAAQGDIIQVTVTVPYKSVSWLPSPWFFGNTTLSETVFMRRE
jgi:Flp pilus assembly protein TadG